MNTMVFNMKSKIRKEIRIIRESLTKEEVDNKSKVITEKFLESEEYKKAKIIMSYMSIKNEIDMETINKKILEDGKKLVLPVMIKEKTTIRAVEVDNICEMATMAFGVKEPKGGKEIMISEIDLIVVPGVAFDKNGNRIGFGKGFYDRFLYKTEVKKIALCYDFQIIDEIESERHDTPVEMILTEKNEYRNIVMKKESL